MTSKKSSAEVAMTCMTKKELQVPFENNNGGPGILVELLRGFVLQRLKINVCDMHNLKQEIRGLR